MKRLYKSRLFEKPVQFGINLLNDDSEIFRTLGEFQLVDIHHEEFPFRVAIYPVVIQLVKILQIG